MYSSHKRADVYNEVVFNQVKALLPNINFIVRYSLPPNRCDLSEMPEIYKQCFMGLRLNAHDGLSNTVMELGLMGRMCVWNGGSPNAIPWNTINDVVAAIYKEQQYIGTTNYMVAEVTKKYLDIGTAWLDTDFYKKRETQNIITPGIL
jgi:hypothetical protein